MYKHILIPIDGSPTADKAVQAGVDFARGAKARVTLFTAVPEYQPPGDAELMARRAVSLWDHERLSRDKAQAILQPAAERLRAAGIECQTAYAECNRPHEAIIDAARAHGCDLILMSSHGRRGLSELWYGSETHAVLKHSSIPTLVYR
ncbi:MAG TPA: universal stress protein [Burkholderiales bacterium]|nr:universal stress protein [Burkholderiales bacterium]